MVTNSQALQSLTSYPLPPNMVARVCQQRSIKADAGMIASDNFQLATADVYDWLSTASTVSEMDATIRLTDDLRAVFSNKAQNLYHALGDAKADTISTYGYIGEDF